MDSSDSKLIVVFLDSNNNRQINSVTVNNIYNTLRLVLYTIINIYRYYNIGEN